MPLPELSLRSSVVGDTGFSVSYRCHPFLPSATTMTLTKGSFTYSSGEEYRGEWKEGEQGLRAAYFTSQDTAPHRTCPLFQGLMKEWEMSSVFPLLDQ